MQNHTRFDGPDRRSSEEISSDPAKSSRSARNRHPSVWGTFLDTQQRDTKFKGLEKELKKDTNKATPKVTPELWWSELSKLGIAPTDKQLSNGLASLNPLMQRAQLLQESLQEKIIGVYDNAQDAKQVGQMLKDIKQSSDKLKDMQNFLLEKRKERMDRIQSKFQEWMNKEGKFIDDYNRYMINQNMPEESRKREMAARKDVFNKNKKWLKSYLIEKMKKEESLSSIYESICEKIEDYEHYKDYSVKSQIRDMQKDEIKQKMDKMIKQWISEEKKSIEDHNRYMIDQNMSEEKTLKLKACDDYEKSLRTSIDNMLNLNKSESEIIQSMEIIKKQYGNRKIDETIRNWKDQMIDDLNNLLPEQDGSEQDRYEGFGWKYKQESDVRKIIFDEQTADLERYRDEMNKKEEKVVLIEEKVNERISQYNSRKDYFIEGGVAILAQEGNEEEKKKGVREWIKEEIKKIKKMEN